MSAAESKPLSECTEQALDQYFEDLDGHAPGDLYQMVLQQVEKPLFKAVMSYARGNQSRAAEILGINRSTLRKKLRFYGLNA
ncbi:MAG: DNA-binding transcriptional regulator Fis [Gammaproteobacteria bacterium]